MLDEFHTQGTRNTHNALTNHLIEPQPKSYLYGEIGIPPLCQIPPNILAAQKKLPVSSYRTQILNTIEKHQVCLVSGATGKLVNSRFIQFYNLAAH